MKYRRLGRNGPKVSAISMGRGATPVRFDTPEEAEFNAAIHRALDLGITMFDSSDAYWGTRHEVLLARALKARRNEVLITTKFGNIDLPDGKKATNGRPEYVHQCCDESLKRMGLDVIDMYFFHRVDPNVPIEETVGAMSELISRGKVRFIGICEASAKTLRRAHGEHPLTALQTEYSLWFRDVEKDILPACKELGIGYIAYAPLGRGLLTGRIKSVDDIPENDRRRRHPRFHPENLAKNVKLVAELEAMAKSYEATPAQLALAWILARWEGIVPIPGTNNAKNVELNAAAVDLSVNAKDVARLNEIFAFGAGAGERYMPNALKGVGI
ncbi:MAG: aldo/keto reductase [Betaproteobacteria bacterium]|nr:aldo/keto reductase [Betaproteobacteria bacterium]